MSAPAHPQIQTVLDESGQPVSVTVPIELWREITSERETAVLLILSNFSMSTAQILEEVRTLSTPELQLLAVTLRFERLRRVGETASDEELRWLEVINRPLAQESHFDSLSAKWEGDGLTDKEKTELQVILSEREAQNAERADAVQHLSELTGVPFMDLWKQLVGETPDLLVPRN